MRIEGADWWMYSYLALLAAGFITCLFEIRSYIIKGREAMDRLRDREHEREMEWIDKQIELAKAQNGIVESPIVKQCNAVTEGGSVNGATPANQTQQEQHP